MHRSPLGGRQAFTMMEIMIVVALIGLLAVLAIPAFMTSRRRAQDTAFINDLRILSAAFTQYTMTSGDFPPNQGPGVLPPEIVDCMPTRYDFTAATPIGGYWDWDRAPQRGQQIYGCYAGLSVSLPSRTTAQMAEIDARIDDGDLTTGIFRSRAGGYICILEQ